jgi:hypothetical protein
MNELKWASSPKETVLVTKGYAHIFVITIEDGGIYG